MAKKKKVGAKGKYAKWLEPESLILLEGWARDGLTDEQLAGNMGIAPSTLYVWKNAYTEIAESLKNGKEVIDYQVENALLNKALKGDTIAQIFWLKNRKPDKWRDKPAYDTNEQINDEVNDKLINIAKLLTNPVPNRKVPDDE